MEQLFDCQTGLKLRDLESIGMILILNRPFSWSGFTGLRVPHDPNVGIAKNPLQPLPDSAGVMGCFCRHGATEARKDTFTSSSSTSN
jgi:hypothetical protein